MFLLVGILKSSIQQAVRVDCYPDASALFGASLEPRCLQRNCIYQPSGVPNEPWCYFPQETYGYTMTNSVKVTNGYVISLQRLMKYSQPFPEPIDSLKLEIKSLKNSDSTMVLSSKLAYFGASTIVLSNFFDLIV